MILFIVACLALRMYVFSGFLSLFLFLLYQSRDKFKTNDNQLEM